MKKLYASSHLNVYLHEGPPTTVELEWLDFANSDELRRNILEGLRLAQLHRAQSWLADNRLLRAIRPKDFEWMGPAIITPLNELGVKRIAVVESQDAINRMGVTAFLSSVVPDTNITTQYFTTAEEARAWSAQPF
ncbi:MAG: hypothetical protein ACRYFZ_21585 [Janthinobacterium lividum]